MKQVWNKVRIKSTVNVCFRQAKTDRLKRRLLSSAENNTSLRVTLQRRWRQAFEALEPSSNTVHKYTNGASTDVSTCDGVLI